MNAKHPPRIILADRDADVRRALALLLQTALGLQIVGDMPDLSGVFAAGYVHTDLLLLDWTSVAAGKADTIKCLRDLNQQLRIIVLSARPEDRAAALAAGADAFLSKVDSPEQVLAVVRRVLNAEI